MYLLLMIVINKGTANEVIVTVTEKTTITPVYYLFEFTCDTTKSSYYCIATDTSQQTQRYNSFTITEQASNPNTLLGQITLSETGFYNYTIYQQSSSTNLDPDNSSGVVEQGKAKVLHTPVEPTAYDGQTTTYTVYNG